MKSGNQIFNALSQNLLQILLRRADRMDIIILYQEVQYIRRYEGRKRRPQVNIFNAQMQQGQQDADGFLLVPGEHQGQRQVIDAAVKGFGQGYGYHDGAVSVVALSHIHNPGQAADGV